MKFMIENIIARFSIPFDVIVDNGKKFRSKQVRKFYKSFKIKQIFSSTYYP